MNKEVCKACHNITRMPWYSIDDTNWVHGIIYCPSGGVHFHIQEFEKTQQPVSCPYATEHLVMSQQVKANE